MLDKIIEFQRKYKNVYLLNLRDKTYIFREPTLDEWMRLEKFEFSKLNASSYLVDTLLLYPPRENLSAGEILSLGNEIYKIASKFADDNMIAEALDSMTKELNSGDSIESVIMIICSAFPSYKPEDIYEFNFDRLMTRLAQAKKILEPAQTQMPMRGALSDLQVTGLPSAKESLRAALSQHKDKINKLKTYKGLNPHQDTNIKKPNKLRDKTETK